MHGSDIFGLLPCALINGFRQGFLARFDKVPINGLLFPKPVKKLSSALV